ncbi:MULTISPECIES: SPOR domain-containing protein [unclassified Duganella]|uniref:SPOR domain-containing protein n=1 Tax=unclassified Duganella TaxID=2636909 RepID=UPI000E347E90|nr:MULTISPECIES: SPOR domain-containing protein [unclassified Duganella]RFP10629.1 SPOR domain-containing protein [Duganella sp. BJB475]RFP27344.1 SPOR domain-containing protein [Duganella sp. BJB476]
MLKFIFWSLVAINAALFAYGKGYLGHFSGNEREPERLLNQLNADKLAIVSADKANDASAATAAAASAAASAKPAPEVLACVEIGSFVLADARRFETQLAPLNLGDRQSRHNLPGNEVSSYIVYMPPQGSKEGADKKAGELRALGVTNYFIMNDNSPLRWGISLGVFKTESAAQNQLAILMKQGVRTARVAPRMSGSKLLAFQFRDVDTELKAKLEQFRTGYPNAESHACK